MAQLASTIAVHVAAYFPSNSPTALTPLSFRHLASRATVYHRSPLSFLLAHLSLQVRPPIDLTLLTAIVSSVNDLSQSACARESAIALLMEFSSRPALHLYSEQLLKSDCSLSLLFCFRWKRSRAFCGVLSIPFFGRSALSDCILGLPLGLADAISRCKSPSDQC
jgi:hypothetical protein